MTDEQYIPLSALRSYSPHPDKLDLTGLTQDEITHGIKSSKLPDYIRYKQYLTDTNEALAQLAEMIIQFAVNLGLDPDQTLDWARKLQQALPQSEFDSWVATLLDGGPSIFMNTLSELQTTYPNGASGVALVRETDPAKIYVWNGSAWEDFGDYQGIEVKDGTITPEKTNFIKVPQNIMEDLTSSDQGYYLADGSFTTNSSSLIYSLGDINVTQGDTIYWKVGVNAFTRYVTLFDSDGSFISGTTYEGSSNYVGMINEYNISQPNAAIVRMTIHVNEVSDFLITKNKNPNDKTPLSEKVSINGENIDENTITPEKTTFITQSVNLTNSIDYSNQGYYLDNGTFSKTASDVILNAGPIEVKQGDIIYWITGIDKFTRYVTEFDENNNYLTGQVYVGSQNPSGKMSSYSVKNTNATIVRMTIHANEKTNFVLTKNEYPNELRMDSRINISTTKKFTEHGIGFLGDSITFGYDPVANDHSPMMNPWVDQVIQKLGFKQGVNYGTNSAVISTTHERDYSLTALQHYVDMSNDLDFIMVQLGINDAYIGLPVGVMSDRTDATFYGSLHLLNQKLLEKYPPKNSKKIFWSNYFNYDVLNNWDEYSDAIEEVANYYGMPFMDMKRELQISPRADVNYEYWHQEGDGHNAHPTQYGANVIADFVANWIVRQYGAM